jgi:DNA modification methylase
MQLGRNNIGKDINPDFIQLARARVAETQIGLPIIAEEPGKYQASSW